MNNDLYEELVDLLKTIDLKYTELKKAYPNEHDINKKKQLISKLKVLYQNYNNLSVDLLKYKKACNELTKLETLGDQTKIDAKKKEIEKIENNLVTKYSKSKKKKQPSAPSNTGAKETTLDGLKQSLKSNKRLRVKSIRKAVTTGLVLGVTAAATLFLGATAIGAAGLTIHACLNAATTFAKVASCLSYGSITLLSATGAGVFGKVSIDPLYKNTKAHIGSAKVAKVNIDKLTSQIEQTENPLTL